MNDRSFKIIVATMSVEPQKPQTKRDKATAQRRGKILEAAVMCFLENGYHQTGVRDIAARAGVSLGNLYNHFPGKHDVLVEIAALERAELAPYIALLAKPGPARAIFEKFLAGYAAYLAKPENAILTIEITSEAIRKPDIGELFLVNHAELVAALAAILARGVEEGAFRTDLDAQEAAQLVIELIEASAYRSVLSKGPKRKILANLKNFVLAALVGK